MRVDKKNHFIDKTIRKNVLSKNFLIVLLIATFVLIAKANILNVPFHWDATDYATKGIMSVKYNFLPRPALFLFVLKSFINMFGFSVPLMHALIILFSIITLVYVYKIATYLFNRECGVFSTLFLFFSPLFYAQSGIVTPSVFITMLTVIALHYLLKKELFPFLVSLLLVCTAKENGIIIGMALVASSFIFDFIWKNEKKS